MSTKIDPKSSDQSAGILKNESDSLERGSSGSRDFEKASIEPTRALGWVRMTICLIVEAIALGSLSMPSAFATLGMVAGVILTVSIGMLATYASYLVGLVKLKHPEVRVYADACRLVGNKLGPRGGSIMFWVTAAMFVIFLTLVTGSHTLTGTIALVRIIEQNQVCALVWGIISAILLFLLALPPTFHGFAWLGYIDFVSIIVAIIITIVATGVNMHSVPVASQWSAWPAPDTTFASGILAVTNICFAYSFAVCQFSFMDEMYAPEDFVKSITWLGGIEIFIYTLTGALIYAFVGLDVESPALLSAGLLVSRVVFGIALPVIFISGSINSNVAGRFVMERFFGIPETKGARAWLLWVATIAVVTLVGWVIAEAVPFFNALLGLISSLFISGFSFYFPALFWFTLLRDGKTSKRDYGLLVLNIGLLLFGLAILGLGVYASVEDILTTYAKGEVKGAFTCAASAYGA